jgi:hypothetical protein
MANTNTTELGGAAHARQEPREHRQPRRTLLQTGALALAAAAGGRALPPKRASAATGTMKYGDDNDAGASNTTLTSSTGEWSFLATNSGQGTAILGQSETGLGVYGYSSTTGVRGESVGASGTGVHGIANNATSMVGSAGVHGESNAPYGYGVRAQATGTNGHGLYADSEQGRAASFFAKADGTSAVFAQGPTAIEARGQTGIKASGGLLVLPPTDAGVGAYLAGPAVGVVGSVPRQDSDGPGVWGSSNQQVSVSEGAGIKTGVLGQADSFGVVGLSGGGSPAVVKSLGLGAGVVGMGMGGRAPGTPGPVEVGAAGVLGTGPSVGVAGIPNGVDSALIGRISPSAGVVGIGAGAGGRGVYGTNDQGSGVGVLGESGGPRGVGVRGVADSKGVGMLAEAATGATALLVRGINRFTQVGLGQFEPGQRRLVVNGIEATRRSGVLVTLNSLTGPGVYLQHARVNPATKRITLQLSKPSKRPIRFTYFIVDAQPAA